MTKKGAEILRDVLVKEGVEVIFGYPGGVLLPVFDALYEGPIKVVLTRHEQGAAHAADGYARATGKIGVCLATSGPGATNLVTGIATAAFDSVPMLALTGQVRTNLIGNDAFQEADITGITRPITKHNFLVRDVKDLARTLREAIHIATSGRPGPVLVDLPLDVSTGVCDGDIPEVIDLPGYKPRYVGHPRQIKLAAEAINAAERPIIYAGGGAIISGASEELAKLARNGNIPVTLTLLGLGAFPGDDPRFLGMLGMHGTATANYSIQESDLIIAIGARFDDRVTGRLDAFAPHARIIHIDIDPASISKNVHVDIPVVGDARLILEELNKSIETRERQELVAAYPCLAGKASPLLQGRRTQTPVRHRGDRPRLRRQRDHHHRGRAKSDVGRPLLRIQKTPPDHLFRRPRHHGLRLPGRHRRRHRMSRRHSLGYRR